MAITIKGIPVLEDKEADSFVERAENRFSKKQTVSFKKELSAAKAILEKAKLR